MKFFMAMKIPKTTHQQKKVHVVNSKPIFYEPTDLKAARAKLTDHLSQFVPEKKFTGNVRLVVKWLYPVEGNHHDGDYYEKKPDLDNSMKLLQDCMTQLGFWKDDKFVVSLITEKFYADIPGIYIEIEAI